MVTKKRRKKAKPKRKPAEVKPNLSSDALPRRTLEQAIGVAEALHKTHAGIATAWGEVIKTLGIAPKSNQTKYLLWSARAYGLVSVESGQIISLSETGRKIVAPNEENEKEEAVIKALLTPTILSKFYTDYDNHAVPSEIHFPNVLENTYSIPRNLVKSAQKLIIENAKFANILQSSDGSDEPHIYLSATDPSYPGEEESGTESAKNGDDVAIQEKVEWEKVCFFITPIGDDGTNIRKHADLMLTELLEPVAKEFDLKVIRADKIDKSGMITQQIFEYLVKSKLCVMDMSFGNPNAFYELGIRHMTKRPTIQIIRKVDKIPFDVAQGRTIKIDTSDVYTVINQVKSACRELTEHFKHILSASDDKPSEDNPVEVYLPELKVILPR